MPAAKTAAAVKGTKKSKKGTRIHTKTLFYRTKTLELLRKPKYVCKSNPSMSCSEKFKVIKSPLTTESAMRKIEDNNTLVFLVDIKANKRQMSRSFLTSPPPRSTPSSALTDPRRPTSALPPTSTP